MEYVMVPCPAEYAQELSVEIMKLGLAKLMEDWNLDTVSELLRAFSPDQRSFVVLVAQGSSEQGAADLDDVATSLGVTHRVAVATVAEVNSICASNGRPDLVLFDERPQLSEGGETQKRNQLAVGRGVADLILELTGAAADRPPAPS